MAESHPRAGKTKKRRRPARAVLLTSAILAIVFSGLFLARSADAATVAQAAPAATAATSATAAHAATSATSERSAVAAEDQLAGMATVTQPAAGICNLPAVGDLGSLVGLCQAGSGVVGDLNSICTAGAPTPELATSGINSMITTPGGEATGNTLYDNYAMAGQFWASYGLTCSQMTSSIGNNVAAMVFDMAKALDRVTITVYQSAASDNILTWLSSSVDNLIHSLGNAIYYPFLAPMVIIAAMWLAWQGLGRKRATRTIEGTLWMILACVAAIWLIGQPNDFTDVGTTVSNGTTSVLNAAFSKLPATTGSNCLPVGTKDPQSVSANYTFTGGNGLVDQNANELWTVLVCKPWLDGELGTTQYAPLGTPAAQTNVVDLYGRQILWAQAVATNETPDSATVQNKENVYNGIAADLKANNPAVYSLFQGDQWTTRLEIGFEALFAAVAAGLLILLIALTLIMLKLGFLLLLVAGPFFLIIGIHPGFGRVVAVRWFEMLIGVLLKQVAVALTLSVLLYCYSLIMGTTDQVLPWALKIMMIALVTVTVFIYRRPFQHLFSSVGYGMLGAEERAQVNWRESTLGFRRVTANAAGVAVPGVGARVSSRWARRGPDAGGAADGTTADGGGVSAAGATIPEGMTVAPVADSHGTGRQWPDTGVGSGSRAAPPLPLSTQGGPPASGPSVGWARSSAAGAGTGARAPGQPPVRQSGGQPTLRQSGAQPAVRQSPPPTPAARQAAGSRWPETASPTRSGSSGGAAGGEAKPPAAPFWARSRRRSK
jgi:hypothetical protein